MLVLDTSALLAALAEIEPDPALVRRLAEDGDLHAPHLIDIEILHALRGLVRARKLSPDRAEDVCTDVDELTITRYAHQPLADRIWAVRPPDRRRRGIRRARRSAGRAPDHLRRAPRQSPGVNTELYPPT